MLFLIQPEFMCKVFHFSQLLITKLVIIDGTKLVIQDISECQDSFKDIFNTNCFCMQYFTV